MSEQISVWDVRVPMRDGVRLATDITLRDDGVPKPALLTRTPYSRAGARGSDDPVGLARDGWVHVAQDVRGRFDSEGVFEAFDQERDDGADAVAWCAAQPWCDGTVVGWGGSYLGATQLLAAAARPPALKAVAPMITGASFDAGWTFDGGVPAIGFVLSWAANLAAVDPRASARQRAQALAFVKDPEKLYATPLATHPLRKLCPPLDRWLDPTYRWPDAAGPLRRRSLPGFHVAGWFDIFADLSLDTYAAMVQGGAPQRLVVGPWTHAGVFLDATPEELFGFDANGIAGNVRGDALRFLRAAAAGSTADLETGARVFRTGTNTWHDLPSWPPPSTPTTLWLDEAATLASSKPSAAGADHVKHDPRDPVPTRGGRVLQLTLPLAGPCDQRAIEDRPDVAVFSAPASSSAIAVVGTVTARVFVESTAPSTDIAVKLVDVHPDGRAVAVVDGIRRVDTSAGAPVRADVRVGTIAHVFRPGHRVRVEVAASNHPRFEANPHRGEVTIRRGGRTLSAITLPVARG